MKDTVAVMRCGWDTTNTPESDESECALSSMRLHNANHKLFMQPKLSVNVACNDDVKTHPKYANNVCASTGVRFAQPHSVNNRRNTQCKYGSVVQMVGTLISQFSCHGHGTTMDGPSRHRICIQIQFETFGQNV